MEITETMIERLLACYRFQIREEAGRTTFLGLITR